MLTWHPLPRSGRIAFASVLLSTLIRSDPTAEPLGSGQMGFELLCSFQVPGFERKRLLMEEPSRPFQIPYGRDKDPPPVASDLASLLPRADHLPIPSGVPVSLRVVLPRPSASLRGAMLATKQRAMAMQLDRNALQRDCKAPPAHERIPWKKKLAKGAASLAVASVLAATPWEADASVNLLKPEDVALYQEVRPTS